ncbi:hypothetical protein PLESTB_001144300 [Pleodorina starrii]|uniref:Uncharacterized protein n=1 Tax=Pleodorina starrii TaxID=330485 RepID=A0A9W6F5S5_9CHLO|nr:hypothetical protein PLESTB_001144300 [Pleodorina starrii]
MGPATALRPGCSWSGGSSRPHPADTATGGRGPVAWAHEVAGHPLIRAAWERAADLAGALGLRRRRVGHHGGGGGGGGGDGGQEGSAEAGREGKAKRSGGGGGGGGWWS